MRGVRDLKRRHREDLFARCAKRHAARRQDPEPRRSLDEFDQMWHNPHDLFEVIEDEKAFAGAQLILEGPEEGQDPGVAQPNRAGNCSQYQLRVTNAAERDEIGAIGEIMPEFFHQHLGEMSLADPARPGEREQPDLLFNKRAPNKRAFRFPSNQRSPWRKWTNHGRELPGVTIPVAHS